MPLPVRGPNTRLVDEPAPRTGEESRIEAHLDALEFQRSSDVRVRLDSAIELERDAELLGLTRLAMRARLVRADMLHRAGNPTIGAELAREVSAWAWRSGEQAILARSHLVLSSLHEGIGDASAALEHALKALELVDEATPSRARGNFILRLADAFAADGSIDTARERFRDAQRVFAAMPDPERELTALSHLAHAEGLGGDPQQAWKSAQQMQRLAKHNGVELNAEFADTLATAMLGVGRYQEAEAVLEHALETLAASGDVRARTPAGVLRTLAEAQRRRGRLVEAQTTLDRCLVVCRERNLAAIEADALEEQAELWAALGRLDLAFATHKQFHDKVMGLASARREAAVQTRRVMFETAEARRAAEQYWRQARTDPLSALPNRRFLDEELLRRLTEVVGGEPLVVAIIDADHFKRINDTLSHEVGDRAIHGLARALEGSVARMDTGQAASTGLVGRLGGEEFLALLPLSDGEAVITALDSIRAAVAGYDWSVVADGVDLTVSIGATAVRPEDSASEVLRRADAQLYMAKRGGRNQVSFDQPVRGERPSRSSRHGSGRRTVGA